MKAFLRLLMVLALLAMGTANAVAQTSVVYGQFPQPQQVVYGSFQAPQQVVSHPVAVNQQPVSLGREFGYAVKDIVSLPFAAGGGALAAVGAGVNDVAGGAGQLVGGVVYAPVNFVKAIGAGFKEAREWQPYGTAYHGGTVTTIDHPVARQMQPVVFVTAAGGAPHGWVQVQAAGSVSQQQTQQITTPTPPLGNPQQGNTVVIP